MAWEVPDAQGLGTDYDSMPMCVFVKKFAEDEEIDVSQITCAKYFWYYDDEQGVTHKSDEFSTIFPSTSDVNLPYVGYQETIAIGTEEDGTQHLFKMLLKVL